MNLDNTKRLFLRSTGLVFLLFTGIRFVYTGIVLVSSLFFGCQYGIFEKSTFALSAAVEMLFLAGIYYCLLKPAKFLLSLCRIPPLVESPDDINGIIAALLVKCLGIWFFVLGLRELVLSLSFSLVKIDPEASFGNPRLPEILQHLYFSQTVWAIGKGFLFLLVGFFFYFTKSIPNILMGKSPQQPCFRTDEKTPGIHRHTGTWLGLTILLLLSIYTVQKIKYSCEIPIYQIYSCLKLFIQEHHRMPLSRQELLEKGYLKAETETHKEIYEVRCDILEVISRIPAEDKEGKMEGTLSRAPFDKFFIRYGIDKNDLTEKNGVLHDKKTGKTVLLFTGPWSSFLSRTYQKLSTALYKELMKDEETRTGAEKKDASPD